MLIAQSSTMVSLAEDGEFIATGSMNVPRLGHTATLLSNGKVLITGGDSSNNIAKYHNSAELYDPASGTFSYTGSMSTGRSAHTATLLANGKVLITGGMDQYLTDHTLDSAEIYDPETGTFIPTEKMTTKRQWHQAVLLNDGRVLIAGGFDSQAPTTYLNSSEIYDPATGLFTPTGSMNVPRIWFAMTALSDGRVLVAGGSDHYAGSTETSELYDISTGIFSYSGNFATPRWIHEGVLLNNGDVLFAGGSSYASGETRLRSVEIFNISNKEFSSAADMNSARQGPSATLLADGNVFVAGGHNGAVIVDTAEIYDKDSGVFTLTNSAMTTARYGHKATKLNDNTVLLTGGLNENNVILASSERYVTVPKSAENVLFYDDFNDNVIDSAKWTISGNSVYEQDGVMQVKTEVTDSGGHLWSKWMPINGVEPIIVSRRTFQHFQGNYIGRHQLLFDLDGDNVTDFGFGVGYADDSYVNSSTDNCARFGFYLYEGLSGYGRCSTIHSGPISPIWDTWFDEEITYDPVSGILSYAINGQVQDALAVGMLPTTQNIRMRLHFVAWGWYTGHYDYFDDISVVQSSQNQLQCSDWIDNDGDGFVDMNDPGCHTDYDANNSDSYDPLISNEQRDENIGLVAYYPFSDGANDESGNERHGVVYGASPFSNNMISSAYYFDGVDDYIDIPDLYFKNVTVSAIARYDLESVPLNSNDKKVSNIINGWKDTENFSLLIREYPEGKKFVGAFHEYVETGVCYKEFKTLSNTIIQAGEYYHVALTYNGEYIRMYINGEFESEAMRSDVAYSCSADISILPDIRIGVDRVDSGHFKGLIDEVRLYDMALSEAEIQKLYNTKEPILEYSTEAGYKDTELEEPEPFNINFGLHPDKGTANKDELTFKVVCKNKDKPDEVNVILDHIVGIDEKNAFYEQSVAFIKPDNGTILFREIDDNPLYSYVGYDSPGADRDGFTEGESIDFVFSGYPKKEIKIGLMVEESGSWPGLPYVTLQLQTYYADGSFISETEETFSFEEGFDKEEWAGVRILHEKSDIAKVKMSIKESSQTETWIRMFEIIESIPMQVDTQSESAEFRDTNYENGEQYFASSTFPKGEYQFYFEASNGTEAARLPATTTLSFTTGYNGIAFLPGIMGSNLMIDGEDIWPLEHDVVDDLKMKNGESDNKNVYTTEARINIPPLVDKNGKFIDYLEKLDVPIKTIPYDWRLDFDSVIENGVDVDGNIYYASTTLSTTSKSFVLNTIKNLSEESSSGKVTIVAHSMGGLVMKRLMQRLQNDDPVLSEYNYLLKKIDRIIFVASPQIGTPDGLKSLLHGKDLPGFYLIPSKDEVRKLGRDTISTCSLIPSQEYFDKVNELDENDNPVPVEVIKFDKNIENINYEDDEYFAEYYNNYDFKDNEYYFIKDYNELIEFATDQERDGHVENLIDPLVLKPHIISSASSTHTDKYGIDDWKVPNNLKIYQIAGYGKDKTVRGVRYFADKIWFKNPFTEAKFKLGKEILHTPEGDETVVVPSAVYLDNVESFYVNLEETGGKHSDIMDVQEIIDFVDNLIFRDDNIILTDDIGTTSPQTSRMYISVHSPITIGVYDNQDNFTGIIYDDEIGALTIYEEIPNSSYFEEGEGKYLSLEPRQEYHVVMKGMDEGYFTFFAEEVHGMSAVQEIAYHNVPVKPNTVARITFNEENIVGELIMDEDGDGETDYLIPSSESYSDNEAPTSEIDLIGYEINDLIFINEVEIVINAEDNNGGVGVEKIEYSFDNGETWQEYTDPITISNYGEHTIQYRSEDWFGNLEETKSETFWVVTANELIGDVLGELLNYEGDKSIVATATKQIELALNEKFWSDNNHLEKNGGQSVFSHLENAIRHLEGIESMEEVRRKIALAVEILVTLEMEEVEGFESDKKNQKAINKANDKMNEYYDEAQDGENALDKIIGLFSKVWHTVMQIKNLLK